MRKRNVQILFRLTEEEAEHLNELVRKSGRSKEAFLREMVRGYQLCEKPDPEFYKMMRELSAIGNRINQLAVKANALGFVDTPMLREEARKWHEFQIDIRKRYLLPRRSSYQILLAFMSAISVTGIVLILSAVCKSQMIAFVISAAIHVIPIMLPISETSALYRIIVLMPLFYSQYISIMSVEQMHNGMLYAVWSIPVAIALVVIGSIISHKAFSKHQVR